MHVFLLDPQMTCNFKCRVLIVSGYHTNSTAKPLEILDHLYRVFLDQVSFLQRNNQLWNLVKCKNNDRLSLLFQEFDVLLKDIVLIVGRKDSLIDHQLHVAAMDRLFSLFLLNLNFNTFTVKVFEAQDLLVGVLQDIFVCAFFFHICTYGESNWMLRVQLCRVKELVKQVHV